MNQVVNFEFESKAIRVVTDETTGELMWVAKDVCDILELSNVTKALFSLDEDERGLTNIQSPSGIQEYNTITESGLYSLIFKSRKPEAKPFKRWVTHEVLPSIRKTGQYSVSNENQIDTQSLESKESKISALENDHLFSQIDLELEQVQDTILIVSDLINLTRETQRNVIAVQKFHDRIKKIRYRIANKNPNALSPIEESEDLYQPKERRWEQK
mgnify:CR=1 FL=1